MIKKLKQYYNNNFELKDRNQKPFKEPVIIKVIRQKTIDYYAEKMSSDDIEIKTFKTNKNAPSD